MLIKFPQDDNRHQWTNHVKSKMLHYFISPSLVKRIIHSPQRLEEGVAPGTIAAMKPRKTKKPQEVWAMWRQQGEKKIIISTWRYRGVSPKGKKIYIPEDTLEYLAKN